MGKKAIRQVVSNGTSGKTSTIKIVLFGIFIQVKEFTTKFGFVVFLLISLIVYFVVLASVPTESKFYTPILDLSKAAIVAGVFASILKSIQYWGVFRDELREVVLSPDALAKRNDLEEIWDRVSSVLYDHAFPDLGKQIRDAVSKQYLPSSFDPFYCDAFSQQTLIKDLGNGYIQMEELCEYTIYPAKNDVNVKVGYGCFIDIPEDDDGRTCVEIISLVIEGTDYDIDSLAAKQGVNNVTGRYEFQVVIKPDIICRSYRVTRRTRRTMNLKLNQVKNTRVQKIFTGIDRIEIRYPDSIVVDVDSLGLMDDMTDNGSDGSNLILKSYKGIIFGNQGFVITMRNR